MSSLSLKVTTAVEAAARLVVGASCHGVVPLGRRTVVSGAERTLSPVTVVVLSPVPGCARRRKVRRAATRRSTDADNDGAGDDDVSGGAAGSGAVERWDGVNVASADDTEGTFGGSTSAEDNVGVGRPRKLLVTAAAAGVGEGTDGGRDGNGENARFSAFLSLRRRRCGSDDDSAERGRSRRDRHDSSVVDGDDEKAEGDGENEEERRAARRATSGRKKTATLGMQAQMRPMFSSAILFGRRVSADLVRVTKTSSVMRKEGVEILC